MKLHRTSEQSAPKAVKYPTKRSVNLGRREQSSRNIITLVVGILLIGLLAFGTAKFGVIDQLERQQQAQAQYNAVHSQYVQMEEKLSGYAQLEQQYRIYSRNWMSASKDELFIAVDRMLILELMEKHLMPNGQLSSVTVQGNMVTVNMSGMNLSQVSSMIIDLQNEPIVQKAELSVASTNKDSNNAALEFSIIILLQPKEAD